MKKINKFLNNSSDFHQGYFVLLLNLTKPNSVNDENSTFGNEDLNIFIDEKLEYLRGCDEKYIYELSKNLFKGDEIQNGTEVIQLEN